MDLQTILMFILAVLIFITAYWFLTMPNNLPPGPVGVPILGYLPFVKEQIHLQSITLSKKYGNIFHVYFGSKLVIILNDFASTKEAFVKQANVFSGRPCDPEVNNVLGDFPGIALTDGDYWSQHRRLVAHTLKRLGAGTAAMETLLLDEINHLLKMIKQHNGDAIDIRDYLRLSIANNIQILVTGKRFDYDHPSMRHFVKLMNAIEEIEDIIPFKTLFPRLKLLVDKLYPKRLKAIRQLFDTLMAIIKETISEEKRKFVDGQNGSYLQTYLTEQNSRMKENKDQNIFTDAGLLCNIQDLFIAATNSTATTLTWATFYMALHPDVQKRVQSEIDDVIGRHREPSYADRINTPYTEATINEINRVVTHSIFSLPHRTTANAIVFGYHIPKDVTVVANLYAVHYDVTLWGDPENFRPERFIGPNGECLRPEFLIPFSIGKRACVGEGMARMELYLYFVSLMQHFQCVPPEEIKLTLTSSKSGITRKPESQLICLRSRS